MYLLLDIARSLHAFALPGTGQAADYADDVRGSWHLEGG
jgi:hypothetical protein